MAVNHLAVGSNPAWGGNLFFKKKHKKLTHLMSQFDSLIISPIIFSLIIFLALYLNIIMEVIIPDFFGTKKFREKKNNLYEFYKFFNKNTETKTASSINITF